MRSAPWIVIVLVSAAFGLGCSRAWNALNRGGANRDLKALLEAQGVAVENLSCTLVGTTRGATCAFTATAEEVARLVPGLGLHAIEPGASADDELMRLSSAPPPSPHCTATLGGTAGVHVYGVAGRPPQLRLAGGAAFEFLLLYHDAGSARACAWFSYAYG